MERTEFILSAAINWKGIIISGYRHGDCYKTLRDLLSKYTTPDEANLPQREDQGFLTSHNRYVSRAEAFKIAKLNNQIIHKMFDNDDEGILTSEDLY